VKLIASSYYPQLPTIEALLKAPHNVGRQLSELAAVISVATGIPLVAICIIVEKIQGQSEELTQQKQRLIEFYGYTEIIE